MNTEGLRKRMSAIAERYGAIIAVAVAIPAASLLAAHLEPPAFHPRFLVGRQDAAAVRADSGPEEPKPPARPAAPEVVKGIYVSAATAGHGKRFSELVAFVDRTEVNAMVIDVKNDRGEIAYASEDEGVKPHVEKNPSLGNLREFTAPLKEKGIYLIARLFVFQDPALVKLRPDLAIQRKGGGVWRDRKGIPWIDPAAEDAWKYNAAIAKEAFAGGFDEVQLDYVRFPTDGNLSLLMYPFYDKTRPKTDVMESFFAYMDTELRRKNGIPISVDLFGLTMWQHDYDLNIGQKLSVAAPHFDYISPMVYPSHYPAGFGGFANPAAHPYAVVRDNMARGKIAFDGFAAERDAVAAVNPSAAAQMRIATVRPWLQDFDLGANYGVREVRDQIRASMEGGASGWIFWNARNVYTEDAYANEL